MPRKSNPFGETPKRAAPKKRVAPRRAVIKKAAAAPIVSRGPSLLLSSDEKREMIRAHAAMRATRDPVHMATLWAGVAATFLVVIGGWAWAFGPSFLQAASHPLDPSLTGIIDGVSQVGAQAQALNQTSDLKKELDLTTARLNALSAETASQQAAIDTMAQTINATSSNRALFRPSPAAPVEKTVTP